MSESISRLRASQQEIEKAKSEIQSAWKKCLNSLNAGTKGAVMGGFITAILAPFATAAGAPLLPILAVLTSGIGSNLLADFIHDYWNAGNEADRQNHLDKMMQTLQQESDKSDQLLIAVQYIIEKVDALGTAEKMLSSEQFTQFKKQLNRSCLVPVKAAHHRRLVKEVRDILDLIMDKMEDGGQLADHLQADFVVAETNTLGAETKMFVKCIAVKGGEATEAEMGKYIYRLQEKINQKIVNGGLLIVDGTLTPAVHSLAQQNGWIIKSYDNLVDNQLNFSRYRKYLIKDFQQPRIELNMPALADYYVPVEFRTPDQPESSPPSDLFKFVENWVAQPSPVQPLMVLGSYGTGKTTFSRMLACEYAKRFETALENVRNSESTLPRPRIPILINLLDFAGELDSVIRDNLENKCQVKTNSAQLFREMNRLGKFLIILDGFDEMAVRGDKISIEQALANIETLARPDEARVIISGRPEFFIERKEFDIIQRPKLFDKLKQRFVDDYVPVDLTLWSNAQLKMFIQKLVPLVPELAEYGWQYYYDWIIAIPELEKDLAPRPVLLEMIVQTLPDFAGSGEEINRCNLYNNFLHRELRRQAKKRKAHLRMDDSTRFRLLQKLSQQMYANEAGGIRRKDAEKLIKNEIPQSAQLSASELEHQTRDFLSCSFLRPDMKDFTFYFSHRSFRGYFAACELAPQLLDGTAKAQFIDQDCINSLSEILAETCDAEFYRQMVEEGLQKEKVPDWIERTKNGRFLSHLPGGFAVEMVYVPPGPFIYGAEGDGEKPQIAVQEKGLWIDKTPVTNTQYKHFLDANPQHCEPNENEKWAQPWNWRDRNYPENLAEHPIVLVSWQDAQAFCLWAGKTLPLENQWEKAARGIDGRRYAWGNKWDRQKCNSASLWEKKDLFDNDDWQRWLDNEYKKKLQGSAVLTTPVSQFAEYQGPFGCVDCSGNVWEWLENWIDEDEKRRVLRGGAWYLCPQLLVCAVRSNNLPDNRGSYIGFRCTRTV
ncbi:MAG: hypothetical protein DWQ05_19300 [Calditrichaeota bacterium]|nr:MAG: hypothetical protein DWQ05_19300 [Calditrichota bacterium]